MKAKQSDIFGTGNTGGQTRAPGRAMSRLAKAFVLFVSLIGLSVWGGNANAAIRTSTAAGGAWATGATWVGGVAPVAADTVVIATTGASQVTVGAAATCAGVTINSGARLTMSTFALTVNGPWVNNGTFTPGTATVTFGGATAAINAGTGTANFNILRTALTATALTINTPVTATTFTTQANTAVVSITISGTNALTVTGAVTIARPAIGGTTTLAVGAGTLSAGSLALGGTTATRFAAVTVSTGTVTVTGNFTAAGTAVNGGSQFTFTDAGTLNVGGATTAAIPQTTTAWWFTPGTSTVNFTLAGAQTVGANTFNNLTLSGSGIKTTTGATVNGVLDMAGTATVSAAPTYGVAATLQYDTTHTTGAEWLATTVATGGVIINGGTVTLGGAKVMGSNTSIPLTVNTGAALAMSTFLLTLDGDLIVNGTGTVSGTTGGVTITGTVATQNIGAFTTTGTVSMTKTAGTATFTGAVNGAGLTLNGAGGTLNLGTGLTHTFTGVWTTTAGALNGGSSTLNVGGSCSIPPPGATFTAGTGTVNWNAAGAQTVCQYAYNNLTLSNSGAKTMTGVTAIAGDLSITGAATMTGNAAFTAGGALNYSSTGATTLVAPIVIGSYNQTAGTFSAGANAITVSGNWNETGIFNPDTGTVTFNGATAQTISGTSPVGFNNLTVTNGANPNITLATNVTVAGTLTGTVTLTSTCPTDYTLTYAGPTELHSCPSPPTVTTNAATALTASGATLNGTVSSNGAITTVTFDYGLTAGYGSSATATQSPLAANAVNTAVSAAVTGLACNTLYHFRVKGVNSAGTTNGGDLTFTTSACPAVVINTYYPGTASVSAGATSITLGAATGAATQITSGDLLLIMQMQDATIDSTNTATYGTVSAANGGLYEYAIAASAVPLGGGSLSLLPCGTINAYTNAAYVAGSSGQKRFQVIRVPVYASHTLGATTALAWNGSTGGVLAFDVTGALNLNTATVDVSGTGFRGGASRMLAGGAGVNTDYLTLATVNNNASKGEGIAGTPYYVFTAPSTLTNTTVEGYPNGSHARGAPANAGGGGTDHHPVANDENPGGGGGANGGAGGLGGIGWCPTFNAGTPPLYGCGPNSGGLGGNPVTGLGATRLTLGGGGGGGTTNNGTGAGTCFAGPAGLCSSGAAGGGIIMIRSGSMTGNATFNANGSNADSSIRNDGSGGGGAGGVVLISAGSGMGGATINVNGGSGGSNLVPPGSTSAPHGPGGGGGGGYAITSAATAACNNGGGANGVTYNGGVLFGAYGATSGSAGSCATGLTAAQIPGTRLGATSCGPDHYELSVPASSITCLPTTVTVTACADNSNPCGDVATRVTGTASLATTGGTIVTPATFTTGVATTTLSDPLAVDGTAVTVSLTSASIAAQNAATCRGGAGGCTTTFNTAGFIFSGSVGGGVATIPTQVAGTSSGTYYLRAVKTLDNSSHTCGAAFSGAQSVNFAYECNDPTTCYTSDLMSVNGGTATTIARNNNGGHASTTPVNMTFDGNGNAPFTFIYSDVGQVTLWVNKTVNSAVLTGSTNPFVVKPGGFVLSNIVRTSDSFANPAAADAAGAKFVKAGEAFSATVTAVTSTGSTAYNYGKEISPEGVKLTKALVTGLGLTNNPALANPTAFAAFTNGVATGTTFNWPEVGIITLTPSVGDGDYLGTGDITGTTSGNIGRFYPDHFTLSAGSITTRSDVSPACSPASIFTYMNEPFQAGFTLMAKGPSPGNATLLNYVTSATPANNFSKLATATPIPAGFGFAYLDGTTDMSTRIDSSLGISGNWTAGELAATATLAFTRDTAPDGPYGAVKVGIAPVDSDGVALSVLDMDVTAPVGNEHAEVWQTQIRFGRLWLGNAYGSDKFDLIIPFESQYWNGSAFVKNTDDSCTALASGNIALGNKQGGLTAYTGSIAVSVTSNGAGSITLTKPSSAAAGSVDLVANLGSSGIPSNCPSLPYGTSTSAALSYLSGKWCGLNYDRDPTARATFGIYGSSLKKGPIYIRESY